MNTIALLIAERPAISDLFDKNHFYLHYFVEQGNAQRSALPAKASEQTTNFIYQNFPPARRGFRQVRALLGGFTC